MLTSTESRPSARCRSRMTDGRTVHPASMSGVVHFSSFFFSSRRLGSSAIFMARKIGYRQVCGKGEMGALTPGGPRCSCPLTLFTHAH